MMEDLTWGLGMMVVGMGVVFALLVMLMLILMLIGRLDRPRTETSGATAVTSPDTPSTAAGEPQPEAEPTPAGLEILHDGLTRDQVTAVALAVVAHAEHRRAQGAPETRAFQPGANLHLSRWVGAGRSSQNNTWNRR